MKTLKNINITLLFLGLFLTACNSSSTDEHNKDTGAHSHGHESETEVHLNSRQIESLNLKTGTVEHKNMGAKIQINGTLEVPPQSKADISPIKGGIVKKIFVIEGDRVRKGQVLATLQNPDFIDLQTSYHSNLNDLKYLELEYQRQKTLNQEKVTSDKSFQKTESEYNKLKGIVEGQKTQLQILGINTKSVAGGKVYAAINIVSPFNGFVSVVETNVGAYAQPMTKLFEVVNTNDMHADFMVYEKDINKISVGQSIEFSTLNSNKIYQAKVHNISPVFETNPKALHIHADIESDKGSLIPGMYINGHLSVDDYNTTVVPDEAVVEEQGKYYIFIKKENDAHNKEGLTFDKTEVIVGLSVDGYTEISFLSDVNPKMEIALSGAYFLLSEMTKEEAEHEH